jgi:hypothetical protein
LPEGAGAVDNYKKFMDKFYCEKCQKIFEAEGIKEEYSSPIYGPCWKHVFQCPDCGSKCDEYRQKSSPKKNSFDFDNYVENLRNQGGGCNPRGGCCG